MNKKKSLKSLPRDLHAFCCVFVIKFKMITLNRKLSTQLVNCAYKYSVVSHNCVGEVLNRQSRSIHGHNQASLITSNGLHQVYSKGLLNCIPNYGCLGQTRDLSSIKYIPLLVADFISNSWPVQKFTESLIWIHDVTGLQWYSSIILSTLIFRTLIVFPFVIYNEFIDARLAPLGPIFRKEVDKARVEIGEMVRRGELEPKLAKPRLRELMYNFAREKYIEHNVHPGQKFVLIAFQLPLWMFMSFALGNMTWRPTTFMSMDIRESMAEGGTLWFLDLTQVDPFCILPVINFLLLVFAVQVLLEWPGLV